MKNIDKKVSTTFTISPIIMDSLKDQDIKNYSKLVEWCLLKHFKENGINVDNIIL